MSLAIQVRDLSKAYRIGEFNTGALTQDLQRWWALTRGKEDPFLKIGEKNARRKSGTSNIVWSLRDINFEIEEGKAFGVIGKNGAGKSTLLKILSRVTTPTEGEVKMRGRVASLLEVGTGFHPELTGRENIFLNGTILGMRKSEIKRRFDEIVDFAGVERYIDTPVKRYSSGMYVRLAFAVAAHLESETLIVDEVLAVGDADFQKKCLGKMNQISTSQGRTILFVSHNMESVLGLCEESMLLREGSLIAMGKSGDIISEYLSDKKDLDATTIDLIDFNESASYNNDSISFTSLKYIGTVENSNIFSWTSPIVFEISFEALRDLDKSMVGITVTNQSNVNIGTANNAETLFSVKKGRHKVRFEIANHLRHGTYNIHLGAKDKGVDIWWHTEIAYFMVSKFSDNGLEYPEQNAGITRLNSKVEITG